MNSIGALQKLIAFGFEAKTVLVLVKMYLYVFEAIDSSSRNDQVCVIKDLAPQRLRKIEEAKRLIMSRRLRHSVVDLIVY